MASMTKLRRRLQRWDRYAARYGYPPPTVLLFRARPRARPLRGHRRAWVLVENECDRREVRTVYWPTVTDLPVDRELL